MQVFNVIAMSKNNKNSLISNLQIWIDVFKGELKKDRIEISSDLDLCKPRSVNYHQYYLLEELNYLYYLLNGISGSWVASLEDRRQLIKNSIREKIKELH